MKTKIVLIMLLLATAAHAQPNADTSLHYTFRYTTTAIAQVINYRFWLTVFP